MIACILDKLYFSKKKAKKGRGKLNRYYRSNIRNVILYLNFLTYMYSSLYVFI